MHKVEKLLYGPEDVPAWYMCILLGIQHFLTCFGGLVSIPLIIAPSLCLGDDVASNLAKSYLISTIFVSSGVCTLLQTTFGNRLPILQGGTFSFLVPTISLLTLSYFKCNNVIPLRCMEVLMSDKQSNFDKIYFDYNNFNCCQLPNVTQCFPEVTGNQTWIDNLYIDATNDGGQAVVEFDQIWQRRVLEVQGAIITASCVEVFIGMTGLVGIIMALISPLAIAPIITLIGLSLFNTGMQKAATNWTLSCVMMVIVILCSQYLVEIKVPVPTRKNKKCGVKPYPVFKLFSVLIGLFVTWFICFIITVAAPDTAKWNEPSSVWYNVRTDVKSDVISQAPWFRMVYPFQWGMPTFSVAGTVGMLAGVLVSMLESIGDYHACADICEIPPPPLHAINRGIMMEGVACVIAGMLGSGNGTTTYAENIGALGITKAASRRIMQTAAIVLIFLGLVAKVGSVFVTMPEPIVGGLFCIMFGLVTGVGVQNLKYCDLESHRTIFIFGFSLFMGLGLPSWMDQNPGAIDTGSLEFDQIMIVLLSTPPFVAGTIAIFLDNTVSATRKERGLEAWSSSGQYTEKGYASYDIPWLRFITDLPFMKHIPISPAYQKNQSQWPRKICPCSQRETLDDDVEIQFSVDEKTEL